jgi:glycosyltransferase involved in cell wall biosynthesis
MNQKKTVSVVVTIPAFNEASTVAQVIKAVPMDIDGVENIDIAVIDDGSTDGTAEVAAKAGAKVVSFSHNKGLGAAFSEGFRTALGLGADIIVNIDADGQFNPEDIPKLVSPIIEGQADMVTASRFADPDLIPDMPWIKKWGNRRVANIVNKLAGQKLYDVSCGFRAYSRDAALRATLLGGHTYTHEVILDLAFRGLRIIEVPVKVVGVRKFGKSKVAGNLWKYGWHSLLIILRAFRDYRPMRVFGGISSLFLIFALACGSFVFLHFLRTGAFSPYIFVAFLAAGFAFISLICYITALLAGMINRLRIIQDEQLFLLRKQEYSPANERKPQ